MMRRKRQQKDIFMQEIDSYRSLIYHVCYNSVQRGCGRMDEQKVDDLYNEIVATLWEYWSKIRNVEYRTTWVYRVAVNVAMSRYRIEVKTPRFESLGESIHAVAEEDQKETVDYLYDLIECLRSEEKEILLESINGFSQREIGEKHNISENAVSLRIGRIKNKLKKLNEDEQKKANSR